MAQIEILKDKKLKCAFCNGTGIQPLSLKGRCSACRGAGSVELAGLTARCAYCEGMGKAYRSSALSCPVCFGIGAIQIKNQHEICSKCNGKGRTTGSMLYCSLCRGKGASEEGNREDRTISSVIEERMGQIINKLMGVRKEAGKKTKEIERRLQSIKPFVKELEKESLWLNKLGNKIKRGWQSLWGD